MNTLGVWLAAWALHLSFVAAVNTTVELSYSRYRGVELSNGISQWLGIRFAAPPVGRLRFMPPQDPARTSELQMADKHGKYCLATPGNPKSKKTAEDCLFLDVQAPTKATSGSKLPVFLYVQGGGFSTNSNPNINASGLIEASGHSIVVVSFNYRVGPYGFLNDGKHISPNNGLRDQLKVMEWVQKHIAKFGGDPNHVVLGGSSAGAASVAFHMTSNNGTSQGLFHAAIAESPSFATTLTVRESVYQYNQLATRMGCVGHDSLGCLQNKTTEELQAGNINIPLPGAASAPTYMYIPSIDGELVPDYTYRLLAQGKFVKVPAIFGDDSNGGTKFAPKNTSTLVQSNQWLLDQYPFMNLDQLATVNKLYPNPNNTCPDRGCYWRQISNVYGEARYMCPARAFTSVLHQAGVNNTYAYRWNVEDPEQVKQGLGVPHTVELNALWGPDYSPDPPESYKKGSKNAAASPVMQKYWINFIKTYDPNRPDAKTAADGSTTKWQPWTQEAQDRLVFQTGGKTEMEPFGDALNKRCDFWAKNGVSMRM
ncbi:hypothetical protein HIM_02813 [Hirsutella minnesotensis 3608]|nr:hypothetical protein HIM_02813 [Hirsutella minnesotensis 3608]